MGLTIAVLGATFAALIGIAAVGAARDREPTSLATSVTTTLKVGAAPFAAAPPEDSTTLPDLEGVEIPVDDDCVIEAERLAMGDTGSDVRCLQHGLASAGFGEVTVNGRYDSATYAAVERLQTERDLFVDGIVGRETALSIGVWPDEQSFVIRTPPPPSGAVDLWGYPLSSVASAGAAAPPVPGDSGAGKRVVYERRGQRVWAIDSDEQVVRSWLVSGSKYGNEMPGFHEVYSRSEQSTAWNGRAILPLMIRYQETDIGHIGFHAIPLHVSDGTDYQTEGELGTRLSGGCQRQANRDAAFLWDFAPVGTTVVVV